MGVFVVTNTVMTVTYDPVKNARNLAERGLPFEMVDGFDWSNAVIMEDTRKDYGERRFRVFGYIGARLYVAVITPRNDTPHVISLRKANAREVKASGKK